MNDRKTSRKIRAAQKHGDKSGEDLKVAVEFISKKFPSFMLAFWADGDASKGIATTHFEKMKPGQAMNLAVVLLENATKNLASQAGPNTPAAFKEALTQYLQDIEGAQKNLEKRLSALRR